MRNENIYLPIRAGIREVKQLSKDVRLFNISVPEEFTHRPGQFVMLSVWGAGEVPISISSMPGAGGCIELCVRAVGHVTSAINSLDAGGTAWLRGPYGRPFPLEHDVRSILFIAGGIGIVPLRPLIKSFLAKPESASRVNIIYGARNPSEILFGDELQTWAGTGANVIMTVDTCDPETWKGCTGLVTEHLGKPRLDFKDCTAYICGPMPMIQAAMRDLSLMGMPESRIVTTLEAHMKCGVGRCGHCFCGGRLICKDGPVFTYEEIKKYRLSPGIDSL